MALIVDIEKNFGNFHLKTAFECDQDVLALLGASGSGKSVTLKCIAGIEKPDNGKIILDGRTLFDSEKKINLPPQKRRVGYLFQQYALFPNMTVEQNIACGVRDKDKKMIAKRVRDMMTMMDLTGTEKMQPAQLSGGQQQRVALARILVNEPDVLLLDEPFSALDAHLRFQVERDVKAIIEKFDKPVILVSHDRDEAYRLCETIAIMQKGKIDCIGTKDQVFTDPKTAAAAKLTGCKNLSPFVLEGDGRIFAENWGIHLTINGSVEEKNTVGIRMHDIALEGTVNKMTGKVVSVLENPFSFTVFLKFAEGKETLGMELDKPVWIKVRAEKLTVYFDSDKLLLLE